MIHYEMPKEIRSHVLDIQAKQKVKTGNGKFSQQQALSLIVKEHKELVNEKLKKMN